MSAQRYKCIVQYDGTNYVGYQVQPNGNSVQTEIEKALKKMCKGEYIPIQASGRTDSGVHALGQVIHFDYPVAIKADHLMRAMNSLLPADIMLTEIEKAEADFHCRYHAVGKKYIYRVDLNRFPDPFKRQYTLHHPYRFNMENLQKAIKQLEGEHDFTSFCSTKTDKTDLVRTVYEASVIKDEAANELVFTFRGNGFLYNMIRIFVGTLLQIADGLKPVEEIERLLAVKDRRKAGPTAAPEGLYLAKVYYDKEKLKRGE